MVEQKIQAINDLGDKILNEWGINNAKQFGLQACTEAIKALAEVGRLRAERDFFMNTVKHGIGACGYCKNHDEDGNTDWSSELCKACSEEKMENWEWRGSQPVEQMEKGGGE